MGSNPTAFSIFLIENFGLDGGKTSDSLGQMLCKSWLTVILRAVINLIMSHEINTQKISIKIILNVPVR